MSEYEVSAIKYRPQSFDDVVGQKALTATMIGAIKSGKLAHSYLFCGPRGVGKTTCSRIFAKTINWEHRQENGEACNECDSCQAFNEGRSLNINEIDAASNNSVDNIRALIEQVQTPPQMGRYKVFIIDEVHMLSTGAFNAFLKTLEEPPSYAIFILATTEKQKILPTILSRCQIYDFKRIETDDIVYQLNKIATKEGIKAEEEALRVIAEKADGGMRDALSIFDQQTIFTGGNITYEEVIKNLNILDYSSYFTIFDGLIAGQISKVLVDFGDIASRGFDGRDFIDGLGAHARNLLMASDNATIRLLQVSRSTMERYRQQAEKCRQKALYKVMKLCSDCSLNYRNSRNKQLLIELTLIEAAQAMSDDSDDHHAAAVKTTTLKPIFSRPAQGAPAAATQKPVAAQSAGVARTAAPAPPQVTKAGNTGTNTATTAATTAVPAAAPAKPATATPSPAAPSQAAPQAGTSGKPASTTATPKIHIMSMADMLRQAGGGEETTETEEKTSEPKTQAAATPVATGEFSDSELMVAWREFAASLPLEQSDMKGRLSAMEPHKTGDTEISAECITDYVLSRAQQMVPTLQAFLRKTLGNDKITVTFKLAERSSNADELLSESEEFKKFVASNTLMEKLNDSLKLSLI